MPLNSGSQDESWSLMLAHDLSMPIVGLLVDLELLLDEIPLDSPARDLAVHSYEQAQRLDLLTQTILIARQDPFEPQEYFRRDSLAEVILEATGLFEQEAVAKGLSIEVSAQEGSFPNIDMVRSRLSLAFKNLIHNAVKFSFRSASRATSRGRITVGGFWADTDRRSYSVAIQSFGRGISPDEIRDRLIFRRGYRGRQSADLGLRGSGLGLAVAERVVTDLHNGTIEVSSTALGDGAGYLTTFTVTLPVKQKR